MTVSNAHTRRKQPELVRRALLDCAARLALDEGLTGLSLQAVAKAAGVTKGGLFHHFPSKEALVEGVFADLLGQFDAQIDALMAQDPEPRGSFTRAYVASGLGPGVLGIDGRWAALSISMVADPGLRRVWTDWLSARLQRHHATDSDPALELARLAADGAWLSQEFSTQGKISDLRDRLLALCR